MYQTIKIAVLLLLMQAGNSSLFAQLQREDTSRAVMQLFATDSVKLKQAFGVLGKNISAGRTDSIPHIYNAIGLLYTNHSLTAYALKYYLAAMKLATVSGDTDLLGWCCNNCGAFYKQQGNYTAALKYLLQGLAIFRKLDNKHGLGSVYNSIGDVYENQGNYTASLKFYFAAVNVLQLGGEEKSLPWPYYNIGEVYMFQERYDSAMLYFAKSLALHQQNGDKSGEAWAYNRTGSVLIKQQNYTEAERYCKMSLAMAAAIGENQAKINAHTNLYTIYNAMGKYKEALAHYTALTDLQAAVRNEENVKNLVKQEMQYDFEMQQEAAKAVQTEKDSRAKYAAVLMALMILMVTGAFYYQRRGNKLKAALLEQKEAALAQKEILLKEIHHRVKNNLQVTGSLLDLQLSNIKDEEARVAIRESIARVKTISLIHHQLYRDEQTSVVELSQFTNGLFMQLERLFAKAGQKVVLRINMPETMLDIDTAVPVGLILNELMTNSYKHAFGSGMHTMDIALEKNNSSYTLRYSDSGPGMPANTSPAGSSVGMIIIQNLSRQIGGTFVCNAGSSMFIITFRDAEEMRKTA